MFTHNRKWLEGRPRDQKPDVRATFLLNLDKTKALRMNESWEDTWSVSFQRYVNFKDFIVHMHSTYKFHQEASNLHEVYNGPQDPEILFQVYYREHSVRQYWCLEQERHNTAGWWGRLNTSRGGVLPKLQDIYIRTSQKIHLTFQTPKQQTLLTAAVRKMLLQP